MKKELVCCVIVTYNIGNDFYNCYNAIKNQVDYVIIVDNGSNTDTLKVLKEIENNEYTKVIYNNENLGIATALNRGVKHAIENDFKWIITLDNDSIATDSMVSNMLKEYNNLTENIKKDVVSLFPVYKEQAFKEEKEEEKTEGYEFLLTEITSGNMIKAEVFDKIGFYEEKYFIDYVDIEFSLRLASYGYKQIRIKNSILMHRLGDSSKKSILGKDVVYTNHSPIRRYYLARNSFYVWKKYYRIFPKFVIRDIIYFLYKTLLILIFEKDKDNKVKMIFRGLKDSKLNKTGIYKMN